MSAAGRKPTGARPAAGDAPAPTRRLTDEDAQLTRSRPFVENVGIVVGAFVGSTVIAEVAGAANLGTALSFGQLGFAGALVWVLLRR